LSNQLKSILSHWYPNRDDMSWVLATVVRTEGPCYRKFGAMMMVNELGQWFGMLSGGCLESDIMKKCKKVMYHNKSQLVVYDALTDEETSWLLGIGCGGRVEILLQPVGSQNHYLYLDEILQNLKKGKTTPYQISLTSEQNSIGEESYSSSQHNEQQGFYFSIKPAPEIVVFGGGQDVLPLAEMMVVMGWGLTIIEHRINQLHPLKFPKQAQFIKTPVTELIHSQESVAKINKAQALLIMTHNLTQDGEVLNLIDKLGVLNDQLEPPYLGILGPESRKQKVLLMSDVSASFPIEKLKGPMGLDIGGELPESIALSILSEIHQFIENPLIETSTSISKRRALL